jgi:hypothetical protein
VRHFERLWKGSDGGLGGNEITVGQVLEAADQVLTMTDANVS